MGVATGPPPRMEGMPTGGDTRRPWQRRRWQLWRQGMLGGRGRLRETRHPSQAASLVCALRLLLFPFFPSACLAANALLRAAAVLTTALSVDDAVQEGNRRDAYGNRVDDRGNIVDEARRGGAGGSSFPRSS